MGIGPATVCGLGTTVFAQPFMSYIRVTEPAPNLTASDVFAYQRRTLVPPSCFSLSPLPHVASFCLPELDSNGMAA
jgi:hypothetical protein